MTVYIVSGWIRSGTSMMMTALRAGGMDVAVSDERQRSASGMFDGDGYVGNEEYMEVLQSQLTKEDFCERYDGKAVKVLRHAVLSIPEIVDDEYRIIIMKREPEEVRQSMQALFSQSFDPELSDRISTSLDRIIEVLRARTDVRLEIVNYQDVLDDPETVFSRLVEAGWPIDPTAAATVVDPNKRRFRIEELERGV